MLDVSSDGIAARGNEGPTFDLLVTELYTGVLSDVLDALGWRNQAMSADIRPVFPGAVLVGRAHTLLSADIYHVPNDPYEMEIAAVDSMRPNQVVVAATNASVRTCVWGELLSTATRARGGRGAVIDGHTRDVRQIERMGFPVFSTGMRPVDSLGRGMIVSYGEPISCGGVLVNEGDIVFADVDGVVVIPRAVEDEVIRRAREKVTGEHAMRARLLEGKTLREAFDEFGFL